jgi:hypothetical protein
VTLNAARSGEPDPLADDPFAFRLTKDGRIHIDRGGRTVAVVAGKAAATLASKLEAADPSVAQQLLARASGNYRRGNER